MVESGLYPAELTLLQNGISLKDQKRLGERKKWLYFYYIIAAQQKEEEELKERMKDLREIRGGDYTGETKKIHFPEDFISKIEDLKKKGLEPEIKKLEK